MPDSFVVPNAGQLRLIWGLNGALYALNVMGVVNAGAVAITQALTNTIGTAIKTQAATVAHMSEINTQVTLANIGLRDIRTAGQPEFIDTGAAVAGTLAGDLLPPQIAMCITLRTAQAGAKYRGRCYLPGWGEASNLATGIGPNPVTAVAFVAGIKTALQASGLDLGVIHRPKFAPLVPEPGFITVVTSMVSRDLIWETQRRRAIPGI